MVIFLNDKDIENLLNIKDAIEKMADTFKNYNIKYFLLNRFTFTKDNWWGIAPAYSDKYFYVKVVNVIQDNIKRKLPTIQGLSVLFSRIDGTPLVVFNGSNFIAYKTAIVDVMAIELIYGKKIETLGIIGAGQEAEVHLKLIQKYLKVDNIIITARKNHFRLALKYNIRPVDLTELLQKSNVILALTSSSYPVVIGKLLNQDEILIVSIGAHTPIAREIDDDAIKKCKTYIIDSKEFASMATGDYIQPLQKGILEEKNIMELSQILRSNNIKVEKPAIFKFSGVTIADVGFAEYLYEKAIHYFNVSI
jgi:alanine dehydrogenase